MGYFNGLFTNLRFYVLLTSAILAGSVYYFIGLNDNLPGGGLLSMIQWYALIAVTYLYFTLLASPLTRIFPNLPFRAKYIFARRALGVSAFMFASLHAYFAMYPYLGGPLAVLELPFSTQLPILLGVINWTILFLMASTAFDAAIVKLSSKRWKILHRFVYLVAILVTIHALLLGSHFNDLSDLIPQIFSVAASILLILEAIRFDRFLGQRYANLPKVGISLIVVVIALVIYYFFNILPPQIREKLTFQNSHNDISFKQSKFSHDEDEDFLNNRWLSKHSVHLLGGVFVSGFLVFALIKQSRDKKSTSTGQ